MQKILMKNVRHKIFYFLFTDNFFLIRFPQLSQEAKHVFWESSYKMDFTTFKFLMKNKYKFNLLFVLGGINIVRIGKHVIL